MEWDSGWCHAHVVSEERQANGRQVFKLFYTDPAEPIGSRTQLHHFDKGKQCMNWRPVVAPCCSAASASKAIREQHGSCSHSVAQAPARHGRGGSRCCRQPRKFDSHVEG